MNSLYYECHVTVEPVEGERFDKFTSLCENYRFKPAELLLRKNRLISPERSKDDSFATGHSKTYEDLRIRMDHLTTDLKLDGFKVWRRKIEACVFDEKFDRLFTIDNTVKMVTNERNLAHGA